MSFRRGDSANRILCLLGLGLLLTSACLHVLVRFDHNQHMYIAAGILSAGGLELYSDFAFLQMPVLPLIYGWAFQFVEPGDYLLVGKLFSIVWLAASAGILPETDRSRPFVARR